MDIMKVILDIENKAMDVLDSVDKAQEAQKAAQKAAELEKKFEQETVRRIEALRTEHETEVSEEVQALEKKEAMQAQKLTDLYSANREKWVEELTARVIEG